MACFSTCPTLHLADWCLFPDGILWAHATVPVRIESVTLLGFSSILESARSIVVESSVPLLSVRGMAEMEYRHGYRVPI